MITQEEYNKYELWCMLHSPLNSVFVITQVLPRLNDGIINITGAKQAMLEYTMQLYKKIMNM